MRRPTSLLLPVLVLAIGVALVWSLTHTRDDGSSAGPGIDRDEEARRVQPTLRPGATRVQTTPTAPVPGGVLEGRVVCGSEGCVATVRIRRLPEELGGSRARLVDPPVAPVLDRTQSAADGTFDFDGLRVGRYLADARDGRGRAARTVAVVRHEGSRGFVRLTLDEGTLSLEGRVRHADGTAFRGLVGAVGNGPGRGAWTEGDLVATDAHGAFELTGLVPGIVTLVALVPGVLRHQTAPFRLPHDGPYEFVVDGDVTEVDAVVVKKADGAPLAGAVVHATSDLEAARLATREVADAQGRCRLRGLSGGRTVLTATAPGFADASRRAKEDQSEVRIEMEALGRLVGLVVASGTETPVEGAVVHVMQKGTRRTHAHRIPTDVEGRFALDGLPPGPWLATVLGNGWYAVDIEDLRKRDVGVRVPAGGEVEIRLEVGPACVAEGRVLDDAGVPVAGAWVEILIEMRSYGSAVQTLGLVPSKTADDGTFRLDALVPGQMHRLAASTGGLRLVYTEPFRAVAGETWRGDLRLPPRRSLRVAVRGAGDGKPVAGAPVNVGYVRPGSYDWDREHVVTNREGMALFEPLPSGELQLEVDALGFASHRESLSPESTGRIEHEVQLLTGHVLSGQVVQPDGGPVVEVWVTATLGERVEEVFTNDAGAFHFEDLPAGLWIVRVYVDADDIAAETEARAGREDLRLTVNQNLAPPLIIHVLDPEGRPVPRFESESHADHFSAAGWHTDGRLELAAGHATVWIEICEACTSDGDPLHYAPALLGPFGGQETELEVRLEPGLTIAGVVRGPAGEGIQGVEVRARALDRTARVGWGRRSNRLTTQTDEDGRFALRGLGAGRHWVDLRAPARYAAVDPRVVEAGPSSVEFRLRAALETTLLVVDAEGRPVVGAPVTVMRLLGGSVVSGTTDAKGTAPLARLDHDRSYTLEVTPPTDRPDLRRLLLEDWRPGPGPVVLPEGKTVRGRVVDRTGAPVHKAYVFARHHREQAIDAVKTDGDGRFLVRGFPPGFVDLVAQFREEPYRQSPVVRVTAGDDDAVLVIDGGRELVLRVEEPPPALTGRGVVLVHDSMYEGRLHANFDAKGVLRVEADPQATYALHVFLEEAGFVAWKEGIEGDAGEVLLTFEPALAIRGRVTAPADAGVASVAVEGRGVERRTVVQSDGTFEIRGLPAGTWTVRAYASTPQRPLRAEVRAVAGEPVEIMLR